MIKFCGFTICELAHLWICFSGMSPRICGFAIYGLFKKFACLPPLHIVHITEAVFLDLEYNFIIFVSVRLKHGLP
jgi:hypothetical protein